LDDSRLDTGPSGLLSQANGTVDLSVGILGLVELLSGSLPHHPPTAIGSHLDGALVGDEGRHIFEFFGHEDRDA